MTECEPIRGLWCATLTPLRADGDIDSTALVAHVNGLFGQHVDGVVLFGTTGEGPSFSVFERCAGLESILTAGIPSARIMAATGCASFVDTVSLVEHALLCGCPRCLIMPPFFWKDLTDEGVFRYYANLIDRVGDARLRVYLYHIPQLSGVPIRPEVIARLADAYPGILAGVKDSSGDFVNTAALLDHVPQLSILSGHEPHIPRLIPAGGAGTICGAANLYPNLISALLRPDVAADDETRIRTLLNIVLRFPFVPAFKAIRAVQTGHDAWRAVRPPLIALTRTEGEILFDALRPIGLDRDARSAG